MRIVKLQDIADVLTGYPFRTKVEHDPQGDLRVIQVKDILKDRTLNPDKLTQIRLTGKARPEKKFVHRDDVLVMTRTEKPYAVHLRQELPRTVVQNSFNTVRLRTPGEMEPEFLAMLLNQSLMQSKMAARIKGSSIPYMRVEDLTSLPVPIPSIERQRVLVALEKTLRRERKLHRELEKARQDQLDGLILETRNSNRSFS